MLLAYAVCIIKDDSGVIKKAYSPDLNLNFISPNETFRKFGPLYTKMQREIKSELERRERLKYQFSVPKDFDEYARNTNVDEDRAWIKVFVTFQPTTGIAEKTLPILGHVANLFMLVTGSLVALAAIAVTFSDDNKKAGMAFGVVGALISFLVTGVIYVFSDASNMLRNFGRFLDNKMRKRPFVTEELNGENQNTFNNKMSTSAILTGLTCGAFIATNAIITDIKVYQESMLLSNKYHEKYPNTSEGFNDSVVIAFLVSMTAANLAFQTSFAVRAAKWVDARQRQRNQQDNSEQPDESLNDESRLILPSLNS